MATKKSKTIGSIAALIAAAPKEAKAHVPSMPVDVLLLEGHQAATAAKGIRARLVKLQTFDVVRLDTLPALLEELKSAEATWGTLRITAAQGRNRKSTRAEAEALRADMLESGDFIFRKNAAAKAELARIREGDGLADLVADLQDLAALWRKYTGAWAADEELSEADFKRAEELAAMLADVEDSEEAVAAQERRNQLCWLLEESLTEVRGGARFLLRKSPKRLQPFLSRYQALRRARARRVAKKATSTPV